jgi:methionyl-tRNA formyltransferase
MRVLLLTPVPHLLAEPLNEAGDNFIVTEKPPDTWPEEIDFVVSFGYRHIIPQKTIDYYRGHLINIHISLLPWNRGADPNFWSWFDRTPKGVSIHAIDAGVDTGDILHQTEWMPTSYNKTLRSSHTTLIELAATHFKDNWPRLRSLDWDPILVPTGGSYHRVADKEPWMNKLPLGWDTPVREVEELGAAASRNN